MFDTNSFCERRLPMCLKYFIKTLTLKYSKFLLKNELGKSMNPTKLAFVIK